MNIEDLRAIWTQKDSRETADDFRRMGTAIIAIHAPETGAAPVIDIRTRERLA